MGAVAMVRSNATITVPSPAPSGVLHRLVGREELRNLAAGQLRSELCTRLTEELAVNHGDCREDRCRYVGEVRCVLHGRLGIPVPLDDDALGLVLVEVGVVLQRSGVLGPHGLHRPSGQALVLVELAFVELESSDTQELSHGVLRSWHVQSAGASVPGGPARTLGTYSSNWMRPS